MRHLQPDFDAGDSPHHTLTVATSERGCVQVLTLTDSSFFFVYELSLFFITFPRI